MATPAQPLAKCVLDYIYSIAEELLNKLRAILEAAILYIDQQILYLRALIASMDIAKILSEAAWNLLQSAIEQLQNQLKVGFGPEQAICPEFYAYITDPIQALTEASLSAFLPYKGSFVKKVSASYYFEQLVAYWEAAKAQMVAIIDVVDDALFLAKEQLGNRVP